MEFIDTKLYLYGNITKKKVFGMSAHRSVLYCFTQHSMAFINNIEAP